MATRREILKWSLGALVGLTGVARRAEAASADDLAIVVASSSPIQALNQYELKKLYLGSHITDPAGERIVPFNQAPNAPDRIAFEHNVLGMTPEEVARYWIDRKIRGQGGAPKAIMPVDLLQRVVSRLPHSLTYVRSDQVLADVRVIPIDGKLPGDPGYKLFL